MARDLIRDLNGIPLLVSLIDAPSSDDELKQGADGINTPTFQHNVAVAGALFANAPYASGSQSLELVIRRWRIN